MGVVRAVLLIAAVVAAQSPAPAARESEREMRAGREAHVRFEALAERAKGGDEKSFRALVADLSSPDYQVRIRALGALDQAGNRAAIRHIAPLVDDPSPFVQGWGSVSIMAMWALGTLTRDYAPPPLRRRLLARVCSAVWRRVEPGRAWDLCARWTAPSFAPPPERMHIDKDRAYWRYWWRAHRAEYEGLTFEQGRIP